MQGGANSASETNSAVAEPPVALKAVAVLRSTFSYVTPADLSFAIVVY